MGARVILRVPGAAQHDFVMCCRTGTFTDIVPLTVPDQRRITSLRYVLHRVRDTGA